MSNRCRGCGNANVELKTSISATTLGTAKKYKDVYERVLEKPMNSSMDLSRMLCDVCVSQMDLIASLGTFWKSNEQAMSLSAYESSILSSTYGSSLTSSHHLSSTPKYNDSPANFTASAYAMNLPSTSAQKNNPVFNPLTDDSSFLSPKDPATPIAKGAIKKRKRGRLPKVKSESSLHPKFFFFEKIPNFTPGTTFSKSLNSFQNIRECFAKKLAFKDPLTDLDDIQHIRVNPEDFDGQGKLTDEWRNKFSEAVLWSDLVYHCSHCNTDIKGLLKYMEHMMSAGVPNIRIKCADKNCSREYSALYSYINHATEHDGYLSFCCVFCEPSKLYMNAVCLINHYMEAHKDMNFKLYFCLECAHYCQNISQLRVHIMSQHEAIQNLNASNSSDESDNETPKRKRTDDEWKPPQMEVAIKKIKSQMTLGPKKGNQNKSAALSQTHPGKKFHPKVQDVGNRVTYPCTVIGCNRVLLTLSGLNYHILTHTGEKPYICRTCGKGFRSKALVQTHEAARKCQIPVLPPTADS